MNYTVSLYFQLAQSYDTNSTHVRLIKSLLLVLHITGKAERHCFSKQCIKCFCIYDCSKWNPPDYSPFTSVVVNAMEKMLQSGNPHCNWMSSDDRFQSSKQDSYRVHQVWGRSGERAVENINFFIVAPDHWQSPNGHVQCGKPNRTLQFEQCRTKWGLAPHFESHRYSLLLLETLSSIYYVVCQPAILRND